MLTKPAISDDSIIACLGDNYGLRVAQVTFLPIGADLNSVVYRISAEDGRPYFLKLRRGNFAEVAVTIPAFLQAQGISQVMAAVATNTRQLWVRAHGFYWMVYPFMTGSNGFEVALSKAQWLALGQSMKAIHTIHLPVELAAQVRQESYSPYWRNLVKNFQRQVEINAYDDPIAASLAAFWLIKREEIQRMVERAEELGQILEQRAIEFVLCHADLHAGNVLLGANDALAIVDWDEPILAPKERDLMFIGAGIGEVWNEAQEEALFFQGYGKTEIDPVALSYYRYERIVEDIAVYCREIFGLIGSAEDRAEGLQQLLGQFLPNGVVEIAHRSYAYKGEA